MISRPHLFAVTMCLLSTVIVISFGVACYGGIIMLTQGYEKGYEIANGGVFVLLPSFIVFAILAFVAMGGGFDDAPANLVDEIG